MLLMLGVIFIILIGITMFTYLASQVPTGYILKAGCLMPGMC